MQKILNLTQHQATQDQLDDARLTAICHEVMNDWMCAENCYNRSLYFDML